MLRGPILSATRPARPRPMQTEKPKSVVGLDVSFVLLRNVKASSCPRTHTAFWNEGVSGRLSVTHCGIQM